MIAACRAGNSSYLAHSQAFKTATGKEMVLAKYQHEALEECMILAYRNKTVGLINQQFYRILSKDKQKVVPFYFQNGLGRGGFLLELKSCSIIMMIVFKIMAIRIVNLVRS